jgi:hypothetical protein
MVAMKYGNFEVARFIARESVIDSSEELLQMLNVAHLGDTCKDRKLHNFINYRARRQWLAAFSDQYMHLVGQSDATPLFKCGWNLAMCFMKDLVVCFMKDLVVCFIKDQPHSHQGVTGDLVRWLFVDSKNLEMLAFLRSRMNPDEEFWITYTHEDVVQFVNGFWACFPRELVGTLFSVDELMRDLA